MIATSDRFLQCPPLPGVRKGRGHYREGAAMLSRSLSASGRKAPRGCILGLPGFPRLPRWCSHEKEPWGLPWDLVREHMIVAQRVRWLGGAASHGALGQ